MISSLFVLFFPLIDNYTLHIKNLIAHITAHEKKSCESVLLTLTVSLYC